MGLLQVEHIDTGPWDERGGLLLGLRHGVTPQSLLGEGNALVEPCQDGVASIAQYVWGLS
jgi:hypothetical protein